MKKYTVIKSFRDNVTKTFYNPGDVVEIDDCRVQKLRGCNVIGGEVKPVNRGIFETATKPAPVEKATEKKPEEKSTQKKPYESRRK